MTAPAVLPSAIAGAAADRTPGGAKAAGDGVDKAAKDLEAFFLRRLLAEARAGEGGGMLDGGFAGDTFKEMLDGALSDQMAKAGGIGLAPVIAASLRRGQTEDAAAGPVAALHPGAPALPLPRPGSYGPTGVIPADARPGAELVRPAVGRLTSGFGMRIDPITHEVGGHPGLDIAVPVGTPVVAAEAGTVVRAGAAGTYGNLVVLRHPDGLETRYAHLSEVHVTVGQHVGAGQDIAASGATGRVTGPHLHFEVRKDGKPLDPRPYLENRPAGLKPPAGRPMP